MNKMMNIYNIRIYIKILIIILIKMEKMKVMKIWRKRNNGVQKKLFQNLENFQKTKLA